MGLSDTQGSVGGFTPPSPLELFTPQVWRDAFQQYQERTYVMGKIPPIDVLPNNTKDFRYQLIDPIIMDAGGEDPDEVMPGAEFPETTVSDITWTKGVIRGWGYSAWMDVDLKKDARMMMRLRENMIKRMGNWLEKKCWEDMTGGTLTDTSGILSCTTAFADGGEFDAYFADDSRIEGGYCSSGGTTNTICLGQQDGYEWQADDGNPVVDFLNICTLLQDQMRVAEHEGQYVYIPWDLSSTVVLTDSVTLNAIYAWLLNNTDNKYPVVRNMDNSFTVPGLWGMTFRAANRAMPRGTINIGGINTGYGLCIIYDESEKPWQGYQYFPSDWAGWSNAGVVNGWDMMGWKRDIKEDERGLSKAAMWTSVGIETYFPRKLCLYGGFRKGETI